MQETLWPWLALLGLGAFHGINPGMGWLFAVALGMQKGEERAVWRALIPLAAGHTLAIAAAVAVAAAVGLVVPVVQLKWLVAALLALMGLRQLRGHAHPRWGGMRIGARDLAIWSFLVATAHGAGLMAVPLAMEAGAVHVARAAHAHHHRQGTVRPLEIQAASLVSHAAHVHGNDERALVTPASVREAPLSSAHELAPLAATVIHTLGYLLVTALLAVLVYRWVGLGVLRRAWVNLDRVWALVLLATAAATALL
jgi:hypothetical protein